MSQMLLYSKIAPAPAKNEQLFSGIWLRWSTLTTAEQCICINIVLLPIWWITGLLGYIHLFVLLGIFYYEWRYHGKIRLKPPRLEVIALLLFNSYDYIDSIALFFNVYSSIDVLPEYAVNLNDLIKKGILFYVWPCLIWYIQSRNIRVRLEPVAWACSISVAQMILLWIVLQFFLPGWLMMKVPTVYHALTGISEAKGASLMFYESGRFQFFFGHFQAVTAFLSFIALMSLDLKNRFWSILLLANSAFLIVQTGTRSAWLALPIALMIRCLLGIAKNQKTWVILLLLACVSFTVLSLPPITNSIVNTYQGITQSIGNARRGSTESRSKVYQQTLERIPDKLIFGHKVLGPPAIGGPTLYVHEGNAAIGSHSFILGDLLYIKGLVGFGLYATFWLSLLQWFYQTREERPLFWIAVQTFYFLQLAVTSLFLTISLSTILCMVIRRPRLRGMPAKN
jgi:O-Antigen ligase